MKTEQLVGGGGIEANRKQGAALGGRFFLALSLIPHAFKAKDKRELDLPPATFWPRSQKTT